jgi:hypothetical protein
MRIRICIDVNVRIRIRIKVTSRNRIGIKVTIRNRIRIRIRINEMRIRNSGGSVEDLYRYSFYTPPTSVLE